MPVIGRLDSQVNDVLIEPVGKRRRRDENDGRDPRPATDEARPAATGDAMRDTEVIGDGADDSAHDSVRRDEQLPVWLL